MNPTILIVEDNPDNMTLVAWALEDAGYEYCCVESAEEALEIVEHRPVDLVLMDISLGGMDGKEATRQLRNNPKFVSLPIIAVTAHAIAEEEQAIRDCGVSEMLTKPIGRTRLLETIESFLCSGVRNELGSWLSMTSRTTSPYRRST